MEWRVLRLQVMINIMWLRYTASILQPEYKSIKPLLTCILHSSPITHSASSECFTTPLYFELTTNNLVGNGSVGPIWGLHLIQNMCSDSACLNRQRMAGTCAMVTNLQVPKNLKFLDQLNNQQLWNWASTTNQLIFPSNLPLEMGNLVMQIFTIH